MNFTLAKLQLELITLKTANDANGKFWITVGGDEEEGGGSRIMIDGSGKVLAGAGGKLDGKTFDRVTKKSVDVEEHADLTDKIAKAGANKFGGDANEFTKESSRIAKEYKKTQDLLGETSKPTETKPTFNPDGMGKVNTVKTAKGTEIETRFKVVDADALIASHDRHGNANPNFPQELQPRDRSKLTSQAWVSKTSKNLDVDSLGKTRRADSGAPIIGDDGVVESGNGRSMAIIEAYNNGHADDYRQWIESEAAEFGIDPETIKGMKNPVLVRQRITDVDRGTFTKEANDDDKLVMTATEKARSDAAKLDHGLISKMSENGDLTAVSNREFVNGFIKTLGDAEAAQYFTTDGKLTKQIYDRVQSAVFAKAYNNDRLLELMADDSKPEVKNIISALNASAGQFIQAKAISDSKHAEVTETLSSGIELSLDKEAINVLLDATNAIMEAKNKGLQLEEYLNQTDVFGDGVTKEAAAMALFIKENNRSPARLSSAFKEMATFVNRELEKDETEDLFGDSEKINIIDVLKAANFAVNKQYGSGKPSALDIFDLQDTVNDAGGWHWVTFEDGQHVKGFA